MTRIYVCFHGDPIYAFAVRFSVRSQCAPSMRFHCVHDTPLIVWFALPWRLYCVLTPLSLGSEGWRSSQHTAIISVFHSNRHQIDLRDRTACTFPHPFTLSGRSRSASVIAGMCDKAFSYTIYISVLAILRPKSLSNTRRDAYNDWNYDNL